MGVCLSVYLPFCVQFPLLQTCIDCCTCYYVLDILTVELIVKTGQSERDYHNNFEIELDQF